MRTHTERALLIALPWFLGGVALAPLGLLLGEPGPDPTQRMMVHLAFVVLLGIIVAHRLVPLLTAAWFDAEAWTETTRRLGGAAVLVIVPTGVVGLVTLASAAALRFDPSVQFLQLLSALDIVWVSAALLYGVVFLEGRLMALGSALIMGALCIVALWLYLSTVGFGPDGEWVVDGATLLQTVIPVDTGAALVAVVLLIGGVRRSVGTDDQTTEQARDQS